MGLNPFGEVRDYPSMRAKIGLFTFVGVLLALLILQSKSPALASVLAPASWKVNVFGAQVGVGTALAALALAALAYVAKLHDCISDILGIRKRFDINEILKPLALGCGVTLTVQQVRQLPEKRDYLMPRTFYKYASSGSGRAVIDPHYVVMALTQWCWYWILVELGAVALLTAAGLAMIQQWLAVAAVLALVLLAIALLQALRSDCVEYALEQVEQILLDEQRRSAIVREFHAIQA